MCGAGVYDSTVIVLVLILLIVIRNTININSTAYHRSAAMYICSYS